MLIAVVCQGERKATQGRPMGGLSFYLFVLSGLSAPLSAGTGNIDWQIGTICWIRHVSVLSHAASAFGHNRPFRKLGGVPLGWLLYSGNGQTSYALGSTLATVTFQAPGGGCSSLCSRWQSGGCERRRPIRVDEPSRTRCSRSGFQNAPAVCLPCGHPSRSNRPCWLLFTRSGPSRFFAFA